MHMYCPLRDSIRWTMTPCKSRNLKGKGRGFWPELLWCCIPPRWENSSLLKRPDGRPNSSWMSYVAGAWGMKVHLRSWWRLRRWMCWYMERLHKRIHLDRDKCKPFQRGDSMHWTVNGKLCVRIRSTQDREHGKHTSAAEISYSVSIVLHESPETTKW